MTVDDDRRRSARSSTSCALGEVTVERNAAASAVGHAIGESPQTLGAI